MAMAVVLQAASSSILLVPGFLPFFFIVQIYLAPPFPRERASVLMCFFVFLLGPLAACVAALQIGVLVSNRQNFFLIAIQAILQSFIEFSYRLPTLLLLMPSSSLVRKTALSISEKNINIHNIVFAALIPTPFILTVIHVSTFPERLSSIIPSAFALLTALFPLPLQLGFGRSAKTSRIRRIWLFLIIIQLFSAIAAILNIPRGAIFSTLNAVFTVLWFGSVMTLFYSLYISPISPLFPCRAGLTSLSPPFLTPTRVSSARVFYEDSPLRNLHQTSRGLVSEDFTALRDPFASPTRVERSKSPDPFAPVTPPATPQMLRTYTNIPSSPTPPPGIHSTPCRQKMKMTVKSSLQRIPPRFTNRGVEKEVSTQSLQPFTAAFKKEGENSPEDSSRLSDEAFLSQILLHSLTLEAVGSPASVSGQKGRTDSSLRYQGFETTNPPPTEGARKNNSIQAIASNDANSVSVNLKQHSGSRNATHSLTEGLETTRNTGRPAGYESVKTSICSAGEELKQNGIDLDVYKDQCSGWWDEP